MTDGYGVFADTLTSTAAQWDELQVVHAGGRYAVSYRRDGYLVGVPAARALLEAGS